MHISSPPTPPSPNHPSSYSFSLSPTLQKKIQTNKVRQKKNAKQNKMKQNILSHRKTENKTQSPFCVGPLLLGKGPACPGVECG